MTTINLKDFYPWYTRDEFVEVPDDVAEELLVNKRYEESCRRRIYRNKAQYSLDADDGIECCTAFFAMSPHDVLEYKQMFCRLCNALNSLPEVQGRRIEAHILLGLSINEIAKLEGVTKGSVSVSITRGLIAMKKYLNYF